MPSMAAVNRLVVILIAFTLAGCAAPAGDRPVGRIPPAPPAKTNDCHCGDQARGFAFRGRIVAVLLEQSELQIAYGEIPGVLPAGTSAFKAAPEVLAAVQPGREIFARIEQRHGEWWIFDVRLLLRRPVAP